MILERFCLLQNSVCCASSTTWKVIGLTPVGSIEISFFQVCLCHQLKNFIFHFLVLAWFTLLLAFRCGRNGFAAWGEFSYNMVITGFDEVWLAALVSVILPAGD